VNVSARLEVVAAAPGSGAAGLDPTVGAASSAYARYCSNTWLNVYEKKSAWFSGHAMIGAPGR